MGIKNKGRSSSFFFKQHPQFVHNALLKVALNYVALQISSNTLRRSHFKHVRNHHRREILGLNWWNYHHHGVVPGNYTMQGMQNKVRSCDPRTQALETGEKRRRSCCWGSLTWHLSFLSLQNPFKLVFRHGVEDAAGLAYCTGASAWIYVAPTQSCHSSAELLYHSGSQNAEIKLFNQLLLINL